MRRLAIPAALVALLLLSAAPALAKNGVTPISPKKGDTVPAGQAVTFKMNISGPHNGVFVHVCDSKRKDKDGMICDDVAIGRAKKKAGSRFEYKQKLFDFPEFWLNTPGTYYWQAYRTHCNAAITDCKAEGAIVKFKVG
jgi:hypothetical protein